MPMKTKQPIFSTHYKATDHGARIRRCGGRDQRLPVPHPGHGWRHGQRPDAMWCGGWGQVKHKGYISAYFTLHRVTLVHFESSLFNLCDVVLLGLL